MKQDGTVKEKGHPIRIKWLCPKTKKYYKNKSAHYECSCENPCTTSKCGRIYHTYPEKNYRMNTVVPRNSELWNQLFKIRTIIERSIYMVKYPMGITSTKLRDTKSLKADILLAAITQQLTLVITSKLNQTKHFIHKEICSLIFLKTRELNRIFVPFFREPTINFLK